MCSFSFENSPEKLIPVFLIFINVKTKKQKNKKIEKKETKYSEPKFLLIFTLFFFFVVNSISFIALSSYTCFLCRSKFFSFCFINTFFEQKNVYKFFFRLQYCKLIKKEIRCILKYSAFFCCIIFIFTIVV